jgi:DNA-binding NarL/FixJ family response regulator
VTNAQPIRVLLADDHAPTRAQLREAIERDDRFAVVAEVSDGSAAVQAVVRERPALCVLQAEMAGIGGVAVTREITARVPTTKVVILTVSADDDELFDALRAGAVGYLLRDTNAGRLPHALHDAVEGRAAIPRFLVTRLVAEFRDHGPRRRAVLADPGYDLTSREWEVLELLRRGDSTADIAARLFVSPATVRTHVAAVLHKLNVPSREALRELER